MDSHLHRKSPHDAAWRDTPRPLRACGFTGSREDIQAASAYLFCDAAARLQQQNLDGVQVRLPASSTLLENADSAPSTEDEFNKSNPELNSYLQSDNYQSFSQTQLGDELCVSSLESNHSNRSHSTLASSEDLDPDFSPNPPTSSFSARTRNPSSSLIRQLERTQPGDPKPTATEVYEEFPQLPESQPGPSLVNLERSSRPYPPKRAFTADDYPQGPKYRQYTRPIRRHARDEFRETTKDLLRYNNNNQPGAFNDFDPDFSSRKPLQTSFLKQARSFQDPRSLTVPLPKPRREFEFIPRQRSSTGPKRQIQSASRRDFKTDSFPQPHQFSTLNPKTQFNPLNFVPGGVNSSGHLYLPTPGNQPFVLSGTDSSPSFQSPPCSSNHNILHAQGDFNSNLVEPPRPNLFAAPTQPTFQSEPPALQVQNRKRKKSGASRLTATLKRFFFRKTKSEPVNTAFPSASRQSDTDLAKGPKASEQVVDSEAVRTVPTEEQFRGTSYYQVTQFEEELRNPYLTITVDPPPEDYIPSPPQQDTPIMFSASHLDPSSAMLAITKQKSEAMRLAREQGIAVREMCRRAKSDIPPYTFEELIGKGSYGRVYKGHHIPSDSVVAIKVMDIDNLDYETTRDFKDESIKDFIHETKVMSQVKDAGAKNINVFIEAVSIHSQLWLVSEYCPGGSIKTLMRATGDRLEEKFIIPIAREVAEGLKAIHDAGIIHRDVKAGNILIHEEGSIQICDFGVAGVLQSQRDKRSTWIGTPHWMPPELFPNKPGDEVHPYGNEIDVWAYGCTLFECATGNPPNATLRERMQIGRQLNRYTPKLDENYSEGLREIVSYALDANPTTRPSMGDIINHPYIAESRDDYPTEDLRELVKIYYQWSQRGGQRISLFNPGGAVAAEIPGEKGPEEDEAWNFSTTEGFEKRFSIIDLDQLSASLAALETEQPSEPNYNLFNQFSNEEPDERELTAEEKVNFDERVKRGAAAMEGIFDEAKPTYKYETKTDFVPVEQTRRFTDLPLRTETDRSSVASTLIDINLGVYDSSHYASASGTANPPFQLADADTIRAHRSSSRSYRNTSSAGSESQEEFSQVRGPRPPTMDWKFPATASSVDESDPLHLVDDEIAPHDLEPPEPRDDKRDTRAWTFPVMTEEDGPVDEPVDERIQTENSIDWNPNHGVVAPDLLFPPHESPPVRSMSIGEPGEPTVTSTSESRPSTSDSMQSSVSDADYDPFRLDREGTATAPEPYPQRQPLAKAPLIREPSRSFSQRDYEYNGNHPNAGVHTNGFEENQAGSLESIIVRNGFTTITPPTRSERSSVYSQNGGEYNPLATGVNNNFFDFPEPKPPSMESLMEGASDEVVAAELDRLFGELMQGLAATGEAIQSVDTATAAKSDVQYESP